MIVPSLFGAEPLSESEETVSDGVQSTMSRLRDRIEEDSKRARVPLFVIGAGFSADVIPLLSEIGDWIQDNLKSDSADDPGDHKSDWVSAAARGMAAGTASRRDVAQLFSVLQDEGAGYREFWHEFSEVFLAKGWTRKNGREFKGIDKAQPTTHHEFLALETQERRCYTVSLNFDGLTSQALSSISRNGALAIHTASDIDHYFSSSQVVQLPAVFKVRGDVFYAQCTNDACRMSDSSFILKVAGVPRYNGLTCPVCTTGRLKLQFSFPGYRAKEEASFPLLWRIRRFLGSRISSVIVIGFSGRWDRYLLQFLFDLTIERGLLFVDVKPSETEEVNYIDDFLRSFYPSISNCTDSVNSGGEVPSGSAYLYIDTTAKRFMETFQASPSTALKLSESDG